MKSARPNQVHSTEKFKREACDYSWSLRNARKQSYYPEITALMGGGGT